MASASEFNNRMEVYDLSSGFLRLFPTAYSEGELFFLLAVALIAGLARGFSGFGAALIFMPLAGAILGPRVAAPLLLIVDAITAMGLIPNAWRYHGRPSMPLRIGVGTISGLFTGTAQIGGPPVVAYWLGGSIPSSVVRANIVLYFAISTVRFQSLTRNHVPLCVLRADRGSGDTRLAKSRWDVSVI